MAKTIAVLGATGNQGGSVARYFHSLGWHVLALTRSTTSASSLALSALGISVLEADIDNPSTLLAAFSRAEVIFAVTDFWGPFFSSFAELSKISDRATGEYAFSIEVKRGRNIVDAVEKVLDGGKLEKFVWSTLPSLKEVSRGKYTFAYHFDSKAEVAGYLKGKERLWERSSLLNMGFYVSNLVNYGAIMGSGKVDVLPNIAVDANVYRLWRMGSSFGENLGRTMLYTRSSIRMTLVSSWTYWSARRQSKICLE